MQPTDLNTILDRERRSACVLVRSETPDGPTYFGGLPRLSADQVWPTTSDGVPLHFLAQIDCSCLPAFAKAILPATGALQFFALVDEELRWDRPASAEEPHLGKTTPPAARRVFGQRQPIDNRRRATQVLYAPDNLSLAERQPPPRLGPLHDGSSYLYRQKKWPGEWAFEREPGVTIFPKQVLRAIDTISFPDAFAFDIYGEPCGQYRTLASERVVADLASKGASITDPHDSFGDRMLLHQTLGAPAWMQGSEHLHESHVLLLQLDSDRDLEWLWCDVGMAQFWIRPDDLANRRFDQAFATVGDS